MFQNIFGGGKQIVNDSANAAIVVSTGLLDPTGAYAFGLNASKRSVKHEKHILNKRTRHIAIMFPMASSFFVTIVGAHPGLRMFWFELRGSISTCCVDGFLNFYTIQIARVCNLDTDFDKIFEPAKITLSSSHGISKHT